MYLFDVLVIISRLQVNGHESVPTYNDHISTTVLHFGQYDICVTQQTMN